MEDQQIRDLPGKCLQVCRMLFCQHLLNHQVVLHVTVQEFHHMMGHTEKGQVRIRIVSSFVLALIIHPMRCRGFEKLRLPRISTTWGHLFPFPGNTNPTSRCCTPRPQRRYKIILTPSRRTHRSNDLRTFSCYGYQ